MENGMRDKARSVLKQILTAAGYDVEDVSDPLDLSAIGDEDVFIVLCSDDPDQIDEFDRTTYNLGVDGENLVCRKLLFTLDGSVRTGNCIRWGADEFAKYAGEAARAHLLGRRLDLDLAEPEPAVPKRAETPKADRDDDTLTGPDLLHLPVQVNEKRAIGIAGVQGTVKCKFIPHWYYRYASTGERAIKDKLVSFDSEGAGIVNAINGLRAEMDMRDAAVSPVPFGSEVLQPRIQKSDAEEQLRREIVENLTQRVRFRQEKGDAIFYEEKILKPDRGSVTVDMELVYIPVWQVRGGSRIVEVNAYSGEILAMPMDEGVELL
ncbi:hypothetical protein ABH15_03260 [Methanoculleus taiwanensis]|uniref:Uncharacterized protein n=1 Tax=Methanoculleus taiwanensis TaxID=1550565 RepID=A0A498H678_9EURY|nr:hypothetical protein [Methanoculleus taiwanensis]RXE57154.1 hypothetical protein ABH15_03260 [Methanoculleus taiwanensis]